MLLDGNPVSVKYNCKWGRRKRGQVRNEEGLGTALRSWDVFLKVLAAKGGASKGLEGGIEVVRFMFSRDDEDSSRWTALRGD